MLYGPDAWPSNHDTKIPTTIGQCVFSLLSTWHLCERDVFIHWVPQKKVCITTYIVLTPKHNTTMSWCCCVCWRWRCYCCRWYRRRRRRCSGVLIAMKLIAKGTTSKLVQKCFCEHWACWNASEVVDGRNGPNFNTDAWHADTSCYRHVSNTCFL